MEYRFTMAGAIDSAKRQSLESWLHSYLRGEGRNVAFSDGLKLAPRQYRGPLLLPLRYLSRCTGPEEQMSYRVGVEEFERRVGDIGLAMESDGAEFHDRFRAEYEELT